MDPFVDKPMLIGFVLRVNSKGTGFILDCKPEEWINKSKLHDRRQDLPPVGLYVEVPFELWNEQMYMIDWRPAEPALTAEQYLSDETVAARVAMHLSSDIVDDKPIVTRLACLNAAIAFWGHRTDFFDTEQTLAVAEVFVAWAEGASIPNALAAGNPSEPSEIESDLNGSPALDPSDSEPSNDTPAGSPTEATASSSSRRQPARS